MNISSGSRHTPPLVDLSIELAAVSAAFKSSLPNGIAHALADLVRGMNCYYSNLIEGHNTHPIDIERALNNDYSQNETKRNLQLEAKAHITVQQWIDQGGLAGRATNIEAVCEIHKRFTELLPDELLWVENLDTGERIHIHPGKFRMQDVQAGQHVAIAPENIQIFMQRFEEAYSSLGKLDMILASAAAHHRLLWIHPFLDGNGRVARLMSYAMLLETLDTGGIWSIARGLARHVEDYKSNLAKCDLTRRNDLDGRGNLSTEALAKFTDFFLKECIEQVKFMQSLVQPEQLGHRIQIWAQEKILANEIPAKSDRLFEALLYRGSLPRGEVPHILDTGERNARRTISMLIKKNILRSDNNRAPLCLAFPAKLAGRWLPGLFPEKQA